MDPVIIERFKHMTKQRQVLFNYWDNNLLVAKIALRYCVHPITHKKIIRILIDIQLDIDKGNHAEQYLSRLSREKNDFLVSTMRRKFDCSLASLREYHFVHDSSNTLSSEAERDIHDIFVQIESLSSTLK